MCVCSTLSLFFVYKQQIGVKLGVELERFRGETSGLAISLSREDFLHAKKKRSVFIAPLPIYE